MLSNAEPSAARETGAVGDALAAELHALVTQRVAAISAQAMGYHAASDPAVLRTALERIGLAAGDALGHLWLMQRALPPSAPPSTAPSPTAASSARPPLMAEEASHLSVVATRAAALRDAGIAVEVRLPEDPERLSATTQHTVALVAAMGAAVALGSAAQVRCRIEVRHAADRLRIEFECEGPRARAPEDSEMRRLRTRVMLLGGTTEMRAGGGSWLIAAELPF